MSGVVGLLCTLIFFYVDSIWQKSIFGIASIIAVGAAGFLVWRELYLATKSQIEFDVDLYRSQIFIKDKKSNPDIVVMGRTWEGAQCIEITTRLRFLNNSTNAILISMINPFLKRKRKFNRSQYIKGWVIAFSQQMQELENKGLSLPGRSRSDYYLLRWSIQLPKDFRASFLDSDYNLVLDTQILGQQNYQPEFDLDWTDDNTAKLRTK